MMDMLVMCVDGHRRDDLASRGREQGIVDQVNGAAFMF